MDKREVHFIDGTSAMLARIDAQNAVQQHPDQCSYSPFPESEIKRHKAKKGDAPETGATGDQHKEAMLARIAELEKQVGEKDGQLVAAQARIAELEEVASGSGKGAPVPTMADMTKELDAVEIPDDIDTLSFPKQKAIADKIAAITGAESGNKEQVEAVLRGEVERRAAKAAEGGN